MLANSIASFQAQEYAGTKRLLIITDGEPYYRYPPNDLEIQQLVITKRKLLLGELRNAAKTYVASQITRDKKSHYLVHWDEDDYRSPDYLTSKVTQGTAGNVAMLKKCIHLDLPTGSAFVQCDKAGIRSSLFYSPFLPSTFARTCKGESDELVRSLTHKLSSVRKAFTLPNLDILDNTPSTLVRFHDGRNVESRAAFTQAKAGSRELTNIEAEYLRDVVGKYV